MSVFPKEQSEIHSMQGNHIACVATPSSAPIGGTVELPGRMAIELPWRK